MRAAVAPLGEAGGGAVDMMLWALSSVQQPCCKTTSHSGSGVGLTSVHARGLVWAYGEV